MRNILYSTKIVIFSLVFIVVYNLFLQIEFKHTTISGAPPYGEAESDIPPLSQWEILKQNWKRPNSPPKIGLQIGHLDNNLVPEELNNLLGNTGASSGGFTEVAVNQKIVEITAEILRQKGVEVDILPTTIPPHYWADAFIAIHADGSIDPSATGFKIAPPWRDLTGRSSSLVEALEKPYEAITGLPKDKNITRNMRGYYAFSWWRYEHSIHPMTTAVIVETGFLTNKSDRKLIAGEPSVPANALAQGIVNYLTNQNLISKNK